MSCQLSKAIEDIQKYLDKEGIDSKVIKGNWSPKNILKNEAILAVLSASIVAPFIIPKINNEVINKIELKKEYLIQ